MDGRTDSIYRNSPLTDAAGCNLNPSRK